MNQKPLDEEAIFHAARNFASSAERQQFIQEACRSDAAIVERVKKLLSAYDAEAQENDISMPTRHYDAFAERIGSRVGPYKLKEQIGEGGFGLVFVAEQAEPVKRKVALKVIKPGMDSREILSRFTAERQALALMDHPNIARVLDAGATESGHPYFVMELVRGIPITDYCDQNNLSTRDRVELFITVCHAVQHAHQKGIIHRDIKPSNVLVTSHDGKPVAKVIDFGVAKAINQQLTDQSIYTRFAQMIGTPLYMSPEQAEMSGLDVDTRSDIYSLGVLLYELLTGTTPFDKARFAKAAHDEIRRMIREEEPPPPSTRLSTSASLVSIAAHRHTEPAKLSRLVRGDLDWITMKALEKDRTRRYETPDAFAQDIQRYLNDEVIEARPRSTVDQFAKFVRKNRAAVGMGLVVTLLLLAGISGTSWGWLEARNQARVAKNESDEKEKLRQAEQARAEGERTAKQEAEKNFREAESARVHAQVKVAETQAMLKFIDERIFSAAQPRTELRGLGKDVRLYEAILACLPSLESDFNDAPVVQAMLRKSLGSTFLTLGDRKNAFEQLRRAHATLMIERGSEDEETLDCMEKLAYAYEQEGQSAAGLPLLEEVYDKRKRLLGAEHLVTLQTLALVGVAKAELKRPDQALPLLEEAVAGLKKNRQGSDELLKAQIYLAFAYGNLGRKGEAITLLEANLSECRKRFPPGHDSTLTNLNNLAVLYLETNRPSDAAKLLEEIEAITKQSLPEGIPNSVIAKCTLADTQLAMGRQPEARRLYEHALAEGRRSLPPEHPVIQGCMSKLANCYEQQGLASESLKLREERLQIAKREATQNPRDVLVAENDIARSYTAMSRHSDAASIRERLLLACRRDLPPADFLTADVSYALAGNYEAMNRKKEGQQLREHVVETFQKHLPADDYSTLVGMRYIAEGEERRQRYAQALSWVEQSVAGFKRRGIDDIESLRSHFFQAICLERLDRNEEAFQQHLETYSARAKILHAGHVDLQSSENSICYIGLVLSAHYAWLGEDDKLRELRKRQLQLSTDLKDPINLERISKAVSLSPCERELQTASLDAARRAVELGSTHQYFPFFELALALAEYRTGDFKEAESALITTTEIAGNGGSILPTAAFYRVMCLCHRKDYEQAQTLFDATKLTIKAVPLTRKTVPPGTPHDDLVLWLAHDEAKALLEHR